MSSTPNSPAAAGSWGNGIPRVIVATTALLTFISFWRAAAIVLNDLASSAYYAGGEAEGYIGKTAPWFILAIMLFSYAVRAVYVESCSMFVRGGVYRAVKQSLGGTLAKFSVSALMFDYILTGPISGVAAGRYHCHLHRPRPFRAGDERRGIARAGLSRNRKSQASESEEGRAGDLHLQSGFHVADFVFCGNDHSRRCPSRFPRKSDRRTSHEFAGAVFGKAHLSWLCRRRGHLYSGRSREHGDCGLKRRPESRF